LKHHTSEKKLFGIPIKPGRTGVPTGTEPPPIAKLLTRVFGTGLGTGYTPFAQGTLGSALFVILWVLFVPAKLSYEIIITLLIHGASVPLSGWGERIWGPDPGRITIDEFAGQAVALIGVPRKPFYIISAFILFRIFDSLKLKVIKERVETLPGGWGVTLDDTAAGLISRIIIAIIRKFSAA